MQASMAASTVNGAAFGSSVAFPFFKDLLLDLGLFFIVFGAFVIVSAGNAVNLHRRA